MCKVLNFRQAGKLTNAGQVFVGRPTKWGNPFVIGRDGSRAEVIAKYRAWVSAQPERCAAETWSAGARRSRVTATC